MKNKPTPEAKKERTYLVRLRITAPGLPRARKLIQQHWPFNDIASINRIGDATSRAERLAEIKQTVADAASEIESLKDEMQGWYDSIPENLQDGTKANEVQECHDALETLQEELEGIDFDSVDFPGMY